MQSITLFRHIWRRLRVGRAGLSVHPRQLWRPRVSAFEDRCLLSTLAVSSLLDAGPGSLRQAIIDANATAGADQIQFNLPGSGVRTIHLASPLPTITDPISIDATTQPGYAGKPLVVLDGTNVTGAGLTITAGNSLVAGLVIDHFSGPGLVLDTQGFNVVQGNYIGTNAAGTYAAANKGDGIQLLNGSSDNMIGTNGDGINDAREANVVSSNTGWGISIFGGAHNVVAGNRIGTNATGAGKLGNGSGGVLITAGAATNLVGSNTDGVSDELERNVISGNGGSGVQFTDPYTTGNTVAGNYIGVNAAGNRALANAGNGVDLIDAYGNLIGGTVAAARNIISGNAANGVYESISDFGDNTIQGNYLGTDWTGSVKVSNRGYGMVVDNGATAQIGGRVTGAGNLISGNVKGGIDIAATARWYATATIEGNLIGTDVTGTKALGNGGYGVVVEPTGMATVGGEATEARNIISANAVGGVHATGPNGILVGANYIGTDISGTQPLGNGGDGVRFDGGTYGGQIGTGFGTGYANVIAANRGNGISIRDNSSWCVVGGNFIGTDATGTLALGNRGRGILLATGASYNTIGDALTPNTIAFNGSAGVAVADIATAGTWANTISGNSIHDNTGLGIDLLANNDPLLPPVLTGVQAGASTRVVGTVPYMPFSDLPRVVVDFYANTTADPSGHGEGQRYLGSIFVGRSGKFDVVLQAATLPGEIITATTTAGLSNTTEFSKDVAAVSTLQVQSIVVNGGDIQRSRVTTMTVTFNAPAVLDPGAVHLVLQGGGEVGVSVATANVGGKTIATITFTGAGTVAGSLADGRYDLRLDSTKIHDTLGGLLDGAGTGQQGTDYLLTDAVFALYGDAWGDGTVDAADQALFNVALGSSKGMPNYLAFFDVNNDGKIDSVDAQAFALNFGKSV